jgi:hypothetical protein
MSGENWTPGPWQALPWEADNGGTDWNVWGPKQTNHIGDDNLSGDYGSEHDARLIACAPELYEALSDFVQMGEQYDWDKATTGRDIIMKNARAALRKARGEA